MLLYRMCFSLPAPLVFRCAPPVAKRELFFASGYLLVTKQLYANLMIEQNERRNYISWSFEQGVLNRLKNAVYLRDQTYEL
jgi:hypothetical protein